jgi:hypothetical protein
MEKLNFNVAYLNALYIVKKTAKENKKCRELHKYNSCKQCSLFKSFCKANLIKEKALKLKRIINDD